LRPEEELFVEEEVVELAERIRKEVLGAEQAGDIAAETGELERDFQRLYASFAWGEIWSRPGLDRRTRSAITVAMLVALGRQELLAMHIRGALNNGLTRNELKEILLQTGVYCGAPAARDGFAVARRVLGSLG
jgi:alkylhydroperoxidase/carboxymuconolactone decarboxylase family protein YurZ